MCQRAVGVKVRVDFGLKVTFVGSWTGAGLGGGSGAGAVFFLLGGRGVLECGLAFCFWCEFGGFRVAGSCAPFTSTLRSFKYFDTSAARSGCRSSGEICLEQRRERRGHHRGQSQFGLYFG